MDPRTERRGRALSTDDTPGPTDGSTAPSPADDPAGDAAVVEAPADAAGELAAGPAPGRRRARSRAGRLDLRYSYLDAGSRRAVSALDRTRRGPTAGTPAALAERDAFAAMHTERLATLRARRGPALLRPARPRRRRPRYVGRIGLHDDAGSSCSSTGAHPRPSRSTSDRRAARHGVTRRRHLSTDGRASSRSVEDDVLDLDAFEASATRRGGVGRRRAAARARRAPHRPHARHRRDHPDRAGPHHPFAARRRARRRGRHRAPARRPSRCTARPSCSTRTASGSRSPACCSSVRTRCSCATSSRCCPRSARPASLLRTPGAALPRRRRDRTPIVAPRPQGRPADGAHGRGTRVAGSAASRTQRDRARRRRHDDHADADDVAVPRSRTPSAPTSRTTRRARLRQGRARPARHAARAEDQLDVHEHARQLLETLRESADVRREVNLCWMPLDPRAPASPTCSATTAGSPRSPRG